MGTNFWSGDKMQSLLDKYAFKSGTEIMTVSVNPTLVAINAPKGSIVEFEGTWYKKQDDGLSANWRLFVGYEDSTVYNLFNAENRNLTGFTNFAVNTTSPINGLADYSVTAYPASTPDVALFPRNLNKRNTLTLEYIITSGSAKITIGGGGLATPVEAVIDNTKTSLVMEYTPTAITPLTIDITDEASATGLRLDDLVFSDEQRVVKNFTVTNSIGLAGNDGRTVTANTESVPFDGSGTGWTSGIDGSTGITGNYYVSQHTNSVLNIKISIHGVTSANPAQILILKNGSYYRTIETQYGGAPAVLSGSYLSYAGEFSTTDKVAFTLNGDYTLQLNSTAQHYLNIVETATSSGTVFASDAELDGVGEIVAMPTATIPKGFLKADGSIVSRAAYSKLFDVIGTTYGIGDGSTTFGLPNLEGQFLRGDSSDASIDPDGPRAAGSSQSDEFASHTHGVPNDNNDGFTNTSMKRGDGSISGNTPSQASGGSETRPVNVAVNWCIRYESTKVGSLIVENYDGSFETTEKFLSSDLLVGAGNVDFLEFDIEQGARYLVLGTLGLGSGSGNGTAQVDFRDAANGTGFRYNVPYISSGDPSYALAGNFAVSFIIDAANTNKLYVYKNGTAGIVYGNTSNTNIKILKLPKTMGVATGTFESIKVGYIEDRMNNTEQGGSASAKTVHTRRLNTASGDFANFGTLTNGTTGVQGTANQFILQAGDYHVEASCPAYEINSHQCFLYDVTNSAYILYGQNSFGNASPSAVTMAEVKGKISITEPTTFELCHWIDTARATDGLGRSTYDVTNPSPYEVFSTMKITRVLAR